MNRFVFSILIIAAYHNVAATPCGITKIKSISPPQYCATLSKLSTNLGLPQLTTVYSKTPVMLPQYYAPEHAPICGTPALVEKSVNPVQALYEKLYKLRSKKDKLICKDINGWNICAGELKSAPCAECPPPAPVHIEAQPSHYPVPTACTACDACSAPTACTACSAPVAYPAPTAPATPEMSPELLRTLMGLSTHVPMESAFPCDCQCSQ